MKFITVILFNGKEEIYSSESMDVEYKDGVLVINYIDRNNVSRHVAYNASTWTKMEAS